MKKFDFNQVLRDMDAELLIQDVLNAEQKLWAAHDAMNDIGSLALTEMEIPPNPYL